MSYLDKLAKKGVKKLGKEMGLKHKKKKKKKDKHKYNQPPPAAAYRNAPPPPPPAGGQPPPAYQQQMAQGGGEAYDVGLLQSPDKDQRERDIKNLKKTLAKMKTLAMKTTQE